MPPQHATATTTDGLRIHFDVHANPDATARVVLVHALAMNRANWTEVLVALPDGINAIALDCRGHGASDHGDAPFTLGRFADDVAAVMDEAGWDRAVIAGCSMGGCVALEFLACHPARAAGAVLIDTTAWYGPSAVADWQGRADRARTGGMMSLVSFQRDRWFSPSFLAGHPDVVQRSLEVFVQNDVEAYAATCAMLGSADLRPVLGGITCPVEVVVGAEDYATPVAMSKAICAALAKATLTVIPDVRHFTPIEAPGAIVAAITRLARPAEPLQ